MQGTGQIAAGAMLDGLLVRDLTRSADDEHAFILRPLPSRASRLSEFAARRRQLALQYASRSPAVSRYSHSSMYGHAINKLRTDAAFCDCFDEVRCR